MQFNSIFLYTAPCANGQLRLAGGNIANEGRVEICISNEWGTVCDDSWGNTDAAVVCRQLGYSTQGQIFPMHIECGHILLTTTVVSTGSVAFRSAHFGPGTGPIYLDNVRCRGSESNLTNCPHSPSVSCNYGHSKDAGVRCQGCFDRRINTG